MRLIVSSLSLASLLVACGGSEPTGSVLGRPDPTATPRDGDVDGDGVADASDNCPSIANADQRAVCAYPAPSADTGNAVADGLARINQIRTNLGMDPVVEDGTMSGGCRTHLQYLERLSANLGGPVLAHEEDPARSYYSAEGNQAGIDAVLAYGLDSMPRSIDGWIDSLYHRLPLLHPGLGRIGIAFQNDYACLLYRPGTDESVSLAHPILYPTPDGTDARPFPGNEAPCPTRPDPLEQGACEPSAIVATLTWPGHRFDSVEGSVAALDGTRIEIGQIWYDGGPSAHERQGYLADTIALVASPGTTLSSGTTYEATIAGAVDDVPRTFRWRFRAR